MLLNSDTLETLGARYQFRAIQFINNRLRLGIPLVDDASGSDVRPHVTLHGNDVHHVDLLDYWLIVINDFVTGHNVIFNRVYRYLSGRFSAPKFTRTERKNQFCKKKNLVFGGNVLKKAKIQNIT